MMTSLRRLTCLLMMHLVTDMLIAILNCCSKEELEEDSEDEAVVPASQPMSPSDESSQRKKAIRNKIIAVGRLSRVFALLRYV